MKFLDRLRRIERRIPSLEEYDSGTEFTHRFFLNGMALHEVGREMTPREALLWFAFVRENGLEKFRRGIREITWYNWQPSRDKVTSRTGTT